MSSSTEQCDKITLPGLDALMSTGLLPISPSHWAFKSPSSIHKEIVPNDTPLLRTEGVFEPIRPGSLPKLLVNPITADHGISLSFFEGSGAGRPDSDPDTQSTNNHDRIIGTEDVLSFSNYLALNLDHHQEMPRSIADWDINSAAHDRATWETSQSSFYTSDCGRYTLEHDSVTPCAPFSTRRPYGLFPRIAQSWPPPLMESTNVSTRPTQSLWDAIEECATAPIWKIDQNVYCSRRSPVCSSTVVSAGHDAPEDLNKRELQQLMKPDLFDHNDDFFSNGTGLHAIDPEVFRTGYTPDHILTECGLERDRCTKTSSRPHSPRLVSVEPLLPVLEQHSDACSYFQSEFFDRQATSPRLSDAIDPVHNFEASTLVHSEVPPDKTTLDLPEIQDRKAMSEMQDDRSLLGSEMKSSLEDHENDTSERLPSHAGSPRKRFCDYDADADQDYPAPPDVKRKKADKTEKLEIKAETSPDARAIPTSAVAILQSEVVKECLSSSDTITNDIAGEESLAKDVSLESSAQVADYASDDSARRSAKSEHKKPLLLKLKLRTQARSSSLGSTRVSARIGAAVEDWFGTKDKGNRAQSQETFNYESSLLSSPMVSADDGVDKDPAVPNISSAASKWSDEDLSTLSIMRGDGFSWYEIASSLGRSERACQLKYTKQRSLRPQGKEKRRKSNSTKVLRDRRPFFDKHPEKIAKLMEIYDFRKKEFWSEVASELGCTPKSAELRVVQMLNK